MLRAEVQRSSDEPLTLLAALATVTEHIGLIATVSTTYNEPFHVARKFASLDHISNGRAEWNIVTSGTEREAQNINLSELPTHAFRYHRAAEFLDAQAGVFADSEKIHEINHVGTEFKVRGPLNVPRSPQGRPLLVQAGSSEDGKDFAARYADWFHDDDHRETHARFNATLQIGYFLIGIRAAGLAAGPMAGFNSAGVDAEFFPEGQLRSLLVVNIGRPAQHAPHHRLPRLPYESVVATV